MWMPFFFDCFFKMVLDRSLLVLAADIGVGRKSACIRIKFWA